MILRRPSLKAPPSHYDYLKTDGKKSYAALSSGYKLINNKGVWYLAALDGEKLKAFSLQDRTAANVGSVLRMVAGDRGQATSPEEDGIWLSEEKQEIVLKVGREVASYFKRRRLIANQVIEKELEDGGLIVSAKVGHANQILPDCHGILDSTPAHHQP